MMRRMIPLFVLLSLPSISWTSSLSDFTTDHFEKEKDTVSDRDPFSKPTAEANADPSVLNLQGVMYGPSTRLCLIDGKILKMGHQIGNFLIQDIKPGSCFVQSVSGVTPIKVAGFIKGPDPDPSNFEIALSGAMLPDVLNMVANGGKFNIILPTNLTGAVSLIFHNIPLMDALDSILRVNKLVYAEESGIYRVGEVGAFEGGSHLPTENVTLKYATAAQITPVLQNVLSGQGKIVSDTRTNTLSIKDQPAMIERVKKMISALDVEDTQVRIEAKIVDVTRSFSRALGIRWGFTKAVESGRTGGFGTDSTGTFASGNIVNVNEPVAGSSGFGMVVENLTNDINLEAQITAGEATGDAHVISQPSITTVNNTAATIHSGVDINIKTLTSSGGDATEAGTQSISTGITLTVTPQISAVNDMIKLQIDATESEADFAQQVDGIPSVIENNATTTVVVRNGETTVIGGMIKMRKSNSSSGVPFASRIPILGWLLKSKTIAHSDNELLIFITPRIIGRKMEATGESNLNAAVPKRPEDFPELIIPKKKSYSPSSRFRNSKYHR